MAAVKKLKPTKKNISEALKALGVRPETIRKRLGSIDVDGCRGSFTHCPVARYLGTLLDTQGALEVWYEYIRYQDVAVRTPKGIQDFIDNFDLGSYPELEATW